MRKIVKSLFSRDKFIKITLPIILIIILAIIGFFSFNKKQTKNLSQEEAKAKAQDFVNNYLMQSGNKATVKEITDEYGLYKLKLDIVTSVVESYISKDGKLFFPQALNIEEISSKAGNNANSDTQAAPAATVSKKNDKPVVELFVMSYCPYGTQIEKGILPVISALGNKIDFKLKFCSYAMHGEKELKENLTQYCIQKEQGAKLSAYLDCFLSSSDSASCVSKSGVNKSALDSCVAAADKEYKVTANFTSKTGYQGSFPGFDVFKADNDKYNVAGSPTLIINGEDISTGRDAASLLKTICSAFNNEPKECQTSLSSATPSAGFGSGTESGSADSAGCGQ